MTTKKTDLNITINSQKLWLLTTFAHTERAKALNRMPEKINHIFLGSPFDRLGDSAKAIVDDCRSRMECFNWTKALFNRQVRSEVTRAQIEQELYFDPDAEHYLYCEKITDFIFSPDSTQYIKNTIAYGLYLRRLLNKNGLCRSTSATLQRFDPDIPKLFCENILLYSIGNSDWRSLFPSHDLIEF